MKSTQASFGITFQDTSRDIVGGLENGLSVIEAFSEGRQRMSITEISEVTGLTRAASRRYLLTLVHLGYAEHDGKFFSLTPRVLGLGYAYLSSITLPARIQPLLNAFRKCWQIQVRPPCSTTRTWCIWRDRLRGVSCRSGLASAAGFPRIVHR